jgi:hypothetical protein
MKLGQQSNGVIEHTYLHLLDALALAQHLILKARRKGHHAGLGLVRGEVRLTRGVTGARHSQQREKKESGEEGGVHRVLKSRRAGHPKSNLYEIDYQLNGTCIVWNGFRCTRLKKFHTMQ